MEEGSTSCEVRSLALELAVLVEQLGNDFEVREHGLTYVDGAHVGSWRWGLGVGPNVGAKLPTEAQL
jgi:hypothetical protein